MSLDAPEIAAHFITQRIGLLERNLLGEPCVLEPVDQFRSPIPLRQLHGVGHPKQFTKRQVVRLRNSGESGEFIDIFPFPSRILPIVSATVWSIRLEIASGAIFVSRSIACTSASHS